MTKNNTNTKYLFFDIDTQYDFMLPGGNLYVKDAERIISNLKRLTEFAIKNNIHVFASADSHPKDDPEFERFPPHCLSGSAGNRKIKETYLPNAAVVKYYETNPNVDVEKVSGLIFTKNTFDVFSNPSVDEYLNKIKPEEIILYGVATDYCVKAAAESLLKRGYSVTLVVNAVKAVDPNTEDEIIKNLLAKGMKTTTTEHIIENLN
ncbi:nicotinamidase/pyrazinamidase [bacterium BMS3Abin04]|nr:nicotinamidase/pyrazinamidase [bacterium BMS3Abin04]